MIKLAAIATVAMLCFIATGHAFTKPARMPIEENTNLECVLTLEQPHTADRNPIYKIMVNLTLNENGNDVVALNATHVAADGTNTTATTNTAMPTFGKRKALTSGIGAERAIAIKPEDGRSAIPH